MTAWTDFVLKIMREKNISYKEALQEASKLKRQGKMGPSSTKSNKGKKGKKGGAPYGSSFSPVSVPLSPLYDGIDGQGITTGLGQRGPLTAALTASGGGKKRRTKSKRGTKRRKGRKTRRSKK